MQAPVAAVLESAACIAGAAVGQASAEPAAAVAQAPAVCVPASLVVCALGGAFALQYAYARTNPTALCVMFQHNCTFDSECTAGARGLKEKTEEGHGRTTTEVRGGGGGCGGERFEHTCPTLAKRSPILTSFSLRQKHKY